MSFDLEIPDGVVRPHVLHLPPGRVGTFGPDVTETAALIGRPQDPTQQFVTNVIESYRAGGLWLTLEVLIVMGRQSGKSGGIGLPTALTHCLIDPEPDRVPWTAHRLKTSGEAWDDVKAAIDSTPEISRRVKRISEKDGDEGVEFYGPKGGRGSTLEVLARSEASGRGLGGKSIFLDEWLFGTDGITGALLPILAARPNPRVYYLSSAAKQQSTHLRSLAARAATGNDPSLIAVIFAVPGSWEEPGCRLTKCDHVFEASDDARARKGCALDDEGLWPLANPAVLHGRIKLDFLRDMRRTLAPLEFGREFYGWGEEGDGDAASPITATLWESCADAGSTFEGRPVFGVAVSKDSRSAAIAAAGYRKDGLPHIETVAVATGDAWLVERAKELRKDHRPRGCAVDEGTAAGAHISDLETTSRLRVTAMKTRDCGRACSGLLSKLKAGKVRHRGDLDPYLLAAAVGAQRRDIGPGLWAWAPKTSEVDTVTLEAATNALWLLEDQPRPRPLVARR